MGQRSLDQVMEEIEEQAEDRLKLLQVVDTAPMMQVTREAILDWIEQERRRERDTFGALLEGEPPPQLH